ncbi:MAG: response regulator [Caldithrix sp.]|nr:response regulator [Caldithrix sp.]
MVAKIDDDEIQEKSIEKIDHIWTVFIKSLNDPLDLKFLDGEFGELETLAQQARYNFSLSDETQIASILTEVNKGLWKSTQEKMKKALLDNDENVAEEASRNLKLMHDNMQLAGFASYTGIVSQIKDIIHQSNKYQIDEQFLEEINQSMALVNDRMEAMGKQSKIDDITEGLEEFLKEAEVQKVPEVTEQQEDVVEEEGDVEEEYVSEALTHIETLQNALKPVPEEMDESSFKNAENAIHAIRLSAYMLNKKSTGDLAAQIEDIIEFYANTPEAMSETNTNRIRDGIEKLKKSIQNPDMNVDDAKDTLDSILNEIMLGAEDKTAESQPKAQKPDKKTPDVDDLVEIFKEETDKYLKTLNQFENMVAESSQDYNRLIYAAHSLKSAAKMIGYKDISGLADGIEMIVESVSEGRIQPTEKLGKTVSKAIGVIRDLSDDEEVSSEEVARVLSHLDVKAWGAKEVPESSVEQDQAEEEKIQNVFVSEAEELVNAIYNDLIQLEDMPESDTLVSKIIRNLHTLKGNAMMVDYEKMGNLSHKLEDYFYIFKGQPLAVKETMLGPAYSAIDLLYEMLRAIGEKRDEMVDSYAGKLAELDNKLFYYQNYDQTIADEDEATAKKTAAKEKTLVSEKGGTAIKIPTEHLDKLINMATELVVQRTELSGQLEQIRSLFKTFDTAKKQGYAIDALMEEIKQSRQTIQQLSEDENLKQGSEEKERLMRLAEQLQHLTRELDKATRHINKVYYGFEENVNRITHVSKALHSDILSVRMVPVDQLFQKYKRSIHEMARKQNKKVQVKIEKNQAEMDRAMIEALYDPLLHILRNAVDHGLETPETRKKHKKTQKGTIVLNSWQDKNQVNIQISDDGKGIDTDKVKHKIKQMGLLSDDEIENLTKKDIIDYIFYPDFSTREETTEVSGRGVGLDVVKNEIQRLKGSIRVSSKENEGTTIHLRMPLTLVVTQTLLIKHQGNNIAIPANAIQESISIKQDDIVVDGELQYLNVRGTLLPFIHVGDLLTFTTKGEAEYQYGKALVIHEANISIALGVEELIQRQEIVARSLGELLQDVPYVSGGTILSNGQIAFILDYSKLIHQIEDNYFKTASAFKRDTIVSHIENEMPDQTDYSHLNTPAEIDFKHITERKPWILIVDDSQSVCNFVASVLERNNFEVSKASNGQEALKLVENHLPDLIITDLEMPVMHGFTLIQKLREQTRFNQIPIVILTGRAGQDKKEKGKQLGANAFIMKPFKEGDLLDVIGKYVKTD